MTADTEALPVGFTVVVDEDTVECAPGHLLGGSPLRVMRLSEHGSAAWAEICSGHPRSSGARLLARKLLDAGLIHPIAPSTDTPLGATVIVPAYGRPEMLNTCLASMDDRYPIIVVDDASPDETGIRSVTSRHGATLVRRGHNGGPGAARDSGLTAATTPFVAFVDSDCAPATDWVAALGAHFADPTVAAVAPRIVSLPCPRRQRATTSRGLLDMGARPARVAPRSRVSHVPTAALVVRRAALDTIAPGGSVFDPALRCGEDVDLIWRLVAAGWQIRYDPSVEVVHHEPLSQWGRMAKRFHYGTSAGPLSRRHPGNVDPLVLHPWPTIAIASIIARRPLISAAAVGVALFDGHRKLGTVGVPPKRVAMMTSHAIWQTWLGVSRFCLQFASPLLMIALLTPWGSRRRRVVAGALIASAPLATSPAEPIEQLLDDVAYGAGVWVGSIRERTADPLTPKVLWRSMLTAAQPRKAAP
jgi:mycofactocin system glycosyltransferase